MTAIVRRRADHVETDMRMMTRSRHHLMVPVSPAVKQSSSFSHLSLSRRMSLNTFATMQSIQPT